MLLEFETINYISEVMIQTFTQTRVLDHSFCYDFTELEDGTLKINLYDGGDYIITRSYTKNSFMKKLKECDDNENIGIE